MKNYFNFCIKICSKPHTWFFISLRRIARIYSGMGNYKYALKILTGILNILINRRVKVYEYLKVLI